MDIDFRWALAEGRNTRPIHLNWRTSDGYESRVLCGLDNRTVASGGAEWREHRADAYCCAACLAIYTLRMRPVAWWRILARLQRRQHILRIRRANRLVTDEEAH